MWGPDVNRTFPTSFTLHGVTFCPGRHLCDFVGARPLDVEQPEIDAAFSKLEKYVRNQDLGEARRSGTTPRPVTHAVNDIVAISIAVVVLTLAILAPATRTPEGFWSVGLAAVAVIIAILVRRRFAKHVRVRIVATAAITISAGLGLLMAFAAVFFAVH